MYLKTEAKQTFDKVMVRLTRDFMTAGQDERVAREKGYPNTLMNSARGQGVAAAVDYLRRLNSRFQDGGGWRRRLRKFGFKIRDPFHADIAPEWLVDLKGKSDDLEEAIEEFVERHEKRRLHKHASRGNISGMENFLDIRTDLVRLLYVYYKRGIAKRGKLIGRFCTFIELATLGNNSENDPFDGYLNALYDSLGGDVGLLQWICEETNYLGETGP